MLKKDVRVKIFEQLQPHLPGFKPRRKEESFVRTITGGSQRIGVALVDYRPLFKFALPISTRIEEVEEIFNRFAGSPPKYHHMTPTTTTLLAYFYGQSEKKQFMVRFPEDIAAAIADLAPVLRDRIMPFLESHQTVQALDAVVNGPEAHGSTGPTHRIGR